MSRTSRNMQYAILLITALLGSSYGYDYDAEPSQTEDTHSNRPRFLRVYSRSHPDAEKQVGVGFKQHLDNVLGGGTFGIHTEFRPMSPIRRFLDKVSSIFPSKNYPKTVDDGIGKRFPDYPEKVPGGLKPIQPPPNGEDDSDWNSENKKEDMESEKADWEHRDPAKPNMDGPQWEDIGEKETNDDNVPIEEIIQPRNRPKRSAENSKIYNIPLHFQTNGKPDKVMIYNNIAH